MRELIREELYKHTLIESVPLKEDERNTDLIKNVGNEIGAGIKFAFTYGTGIGAFLPVIKTIIEKSQIDVPETTIPLLVVTSFGILLGDPSTKELTEEVKRQGLVESLKVVLKYITKIKSILEYVMEKVGKVSVTLMDILSFTTLLVPITNMLNSLILDGSIPPEQINQMGVGLSLSGIGYTLKSFLDSMVNRLRK